MQTAKSLHRSAPTRSAVSVQEIESGKGRSGRDKAVRIRDRRVSGRELDERPVPDRPLLGIDARAARESTDGQTIYGSADAEWKRTQDVEDDILFAFISA